MLNLENAKPTVNDRHVQTITLPHPRSLISFSCSRLLVPLQNYGVKCMSMGFLVPPDSPTIWRGPMVRTHVFTRLESHPCIQVMGALDQMLNQVDWGELDIMVVDLPPGTGDAQLTLTQRAPLSGTRIFTISLLRLLTNSLVQAQ